MESHVIRTQTIFVNSALRSSQDERPSRFTIQIPEGIIGTDDPSHMLRVQLIDFSMPILWDYVNTSNNRFNVIDETTNITHRITIEPANYTFKSLASTISTLLNDKIEGATCTWSPSTNKLTLTFPSDHSFSVDFGIQRSACELMGFDPITYVLPITNQLTSMSTLKTSLFQKLCLAIPNLTVQQQFCNVENTSDGTCAINKNIMSIPFTSPPFDTITYENLNGIMPLYIKERTLTSMTFLIRDEDGNELDYVTNWKASLRVDILDIHSSSQQSHNAAMLDLLNKIEEKMSLLLASKALGM